MLACFETIFFEICRLFSFWPSKRAQKFEEIPFYSFFLTPVWRFCFFLLLFPPFLLLPSSSSSFLRPPRMGFPPSAPWPFGPPVRPCTPYVLVRLWVRVLRSITCFDPQCRHKDDGGRSPLRKVFHTVVLIFSSRPCHKKRIIIK